VTTAVVPKHLGRQYIVIEQEETYCLFAEKRLELAEQEPAIQGYSGGYFWERNTLAHQSRKKPQPAVPAGDQPELFEQTS